MTKYCERMHWLTSDFAYRIRPPIEHAGQKTCTEMLSTIQEAIGVGQPFTAVDDLPPLLRQLHQESDFHIVGNHVLKKMDPIASALDGNAGTEIQDADAVVLEDYEDELLDRQDVLDYLRSNCESFNSSEDAINHADRGLIDMASNQSENDFIASFETGPDDRSIYELLDTESLNSPFCGLGYKPPRDSYQFCDVERRSLWGEKKAERDQAFGDLKAEATDLDTVQDAYAFMDNIREDYYRDKALRMLWNIEAFKEDRSIYADSLRRQGLDEETIRGKLWAAFDRKACIVPVVIAGGQVLQQRRETKDSFWNKARSEALQELFLTTKQWSEIYAIARERQQWCGKEGSIQTLSAVKKRIDKIETMQEQQILKQYLVMKNIHLVPNHRGEMWRHFSLKSNLLIKQESQMSCRVQDAPGRVSPAPRAKQSVHAVKPHSIHPISR